MKKIITLFFITGIINATSINLGGIINVKIPTPSVGDIGDDIGGGSGSVKRDGENYIIQGASNNKTVTLNGEAVIIQGASNTLTIKGKVSSITIRGAGNTVNVESVKSIRIQGASNVVYYKTALTKSGKASVSISGAGSRVVKK
ncbi:DUF3060 domain-containing protein [Leptotrichia sp. OH3620_COT-345]|uniref:DUF3060 domain-containing protein n=1 Tax=Leptotrichia sp. OH3620_COT-345 TaxID=2491048 RepID=UPI000F64A8FB|nr:DUF3060 domain-containing protein [Leptotrichia sp. OH3620_COT-345]RRD39801.1 DUF3060 domain-containing protein [Leptotrichia sp. OH3620_COT-345]